jgi:hypothetical protein
VIGESSSDRGAHCARGNHCNNRSHRVLDLQ